MPDMTSTAKARAALEAAARLILAEIERLPEEGIQDVAVRSVDLDPIEAELTGVARAAGKAFELIARIPPVVRGSVTRFPPGLNRPEGLAFCS